MLYARVIEENSLRVGMIESRSGKPLLLTGAHRCYQHRYAPNHTP